MKFSLQVFISNHQKALPFFSVKREQEFYPNPWKIQLKWNTWTFESEGHYSSNIYTVPKFCLDVPDDTLFATFEDICKEISQKMDCLVCGESYSKYGQPGCGFHGCYKSGIKQGFCPLRDQGQIQHDELVFRSFYKTILITSSSEEFEL